MPDWVVATEVFLLVLVVAALVPIAWVVVRRRWLASRGSVFECSMRRIEGKATGWTLGLANIVGDEMRWYRVFSWSLNPRAVVDRRRTHVVTTRMAQQEERAVLMAGQRVVTLKSSIQEVELALDPVNVTAVLSWLEAAPPGFRYPADR